MNRCKGDTIIYSADTDTVKLFIKKIIFTKIILTKNIFEYIIRTMKRPIKIVEELNDILEKNGIQCFFSYDTKNDRYTFRTYDGTLMNNNYVTQCKIYLKTENQGANNENIGI